MAHRYAMLLKWTVHKIGDKINDARNTLEAKRKLTKILK